MSKLLITSGCSFSECTSDPNHIMTWPRHLYESLKSHGFTNHVSKAMGSQGNGLIGRGIIYSVIKALETHKPEDILVGVMWSGSSRHDYRCTDKSVLSFGDFNQDGWIENPTNFVDDAEKNWVILNHGWQNKEAQTYYKHFHSFAGDMINSIEHILRTQLFLKSKNINYFFTNYVDNNIVDFNDQAYIDNKKEIDYLYNEIDFYNYLPVTSEHRWLLENAKTKEEFKQDHFWNGAWSLWVHPKTKHHKEFVDDVIYPYLLNKGYIT